MAATTPARNYRKNAHTARFLMTFHTGAGSIDAPETDTYEVPEHRGGGSGMVEINRGRVAEVESTGHGFGETCNNTACCPIAAPRDARSEGQVRYMNNLIAWITEKDAEAGQAARIWTDNVTASGKWSYDKTDKFSISTWIDRLKIKNAELNAATKAEPRTAAGPVVTTSGNVQHDELIKRENKSGKAMPQYYAIVEDGVTKFFRVKAGTKPGWWWIDAQASDEFHPIKNVARKNAILNAIIAAGPEASMRLYGQSLGSCGRCHRTLTDETSRANGIGPECEGKL
jgi:hypothetical protein